jgi:hypothetical protein
MGTLPSGRPSGNVPGAGCDARRQRSSGRLFGAALYNPVWTSSVKTPEDFGIALVGFILLAVWPLVEVIISALAGSPLV